MQVKLVDNKKELIEWDKLYVNFVDKIVFYKNQVFDLDTFKEEFK